MVSIDVARDVAPVVTKDRPLVSNPEKPRTSPPSTITLTDSHAESLRQVNLLPQGATTEDDLTTFNIRGLVSTRLQPLFDNYVPESWRNRVDPQTGEVIHPASIDEIHEVRRLIVESYRANARKLRDRHTVDPILNTTINYRFLDTQQEEYSRILAGLRTYERSQRHPDQQSPLDETEVTKLSSEALRRRFAYEIGDKLLFTLLEQAEQHGTGPILRTGDIRAGNITRKSLDQNNTLPSMERFLPVLDRMSTEYTSQITLCRGISRLIHLAESQGIPLDQGTVYGDLMETLRENLQYSRVGYEETITKIKGMSLEAADNVLENTV